MFDLASMRPQEFPCQCPYCYSDLSADNIIGENEYDVINIGHIQGGTAVVFECPVCYEKSFLHKDSLQWIIYKN